MWQRGEVFKKASGMRGELWAPRSAVECSEMARMQEVDVGEPLDALESYMRLRKQTGSVETKKAVKEMQPRRKCVNTKKSMND